VWETFTDPSVGLSQYWETFSDPSTGLSQYWETFTDPSTGKNIVLFIPKTAQFMCFCYRKTVITTTENFTK
jgi:hypothetical protein